MRSRKQATLVNAPDDKLFLTCEGKAIKNTQEMAAALREMNTQVFQSHVNKEKNDFAAWTKEVLGDRRLAREMRRSRTLPTFIKKVEARIQELE